MASKKTALFFSAIAKLAFTVGGTYSLIKSSVLTVEAGQKAVIFDRTLGVIWSTYGEGTHVILPWFQKAYIFDVRTRPYTLSSVSAATKDLQIVNLTLRVLYRPKLAKIPTIFRTLGLDYDDKVLPSISNEILKSVVAQFNADELVTRRRRVSALVRLGLTRRANAFHIVVDDVSITELSYGAEFSKAVEQKQVAQQEAERSKFEVAKAEQESRAAIIRAEGESESAKLISEATAAAGPGLIELRRIEAAREVAATLAKNPNLNYLPGIINKLK